MDNPIVKIRCYCDDVSQPFYYGTGFVIDFNLVLTAAHVLRGDRFTIEDCNGNVFEANVEPILDNHIVGVLKSKSTLNISPAKLTKNFVLSSEEKWELTGFITSYQKIHYVAGRGLNPIKAGNLISDFCLSDINVGKAQDYRGLSGSPILVDNMVVGIAQEQVSFSDVSSDILVSSTRLFSSVLPDSVFQENEILVQAKSSLAKISDIKIDQNIKSAKYIPDIFVEDSSMKECIRYFSDSYLFKQKIIEEYNLLDFKTINKFVNQYLDKSIKPSLDYSIDIVSLLDELNVSKNILEELRNKKYKGGIDDPYLDKICNTSLKFRIEDMVKLIEYSSYQFILLLQKAGQGKTNFLCDFTCNFLKKKDYIYLYLNAHEITTNPKEYFLDKLLTASNKDIEYTLSLLQMNFSLNNRPMVVVIDGLNENSLINNFALEMRYFLEFLIDKPFIKVLMTSRSEFFNERFSLLIQGITEKIFHVKDVNRHFPSKVFQERLFWGHIDFFRISISPGSLYKSTFEQLVKSPLLLRFFCEVNKGKKAVHMYHIYQYSLFQEYLEKKLEEYRIKHLDIMDFHSVYYAVFDKLIEYILKFDVYHNIPVNIFNDQEKILVADLVLNDVLFKDEHEVQQGIVDVKTILISFTFDEFRDYYITIYIAKSLSTQKIVDFINKLPGKTIAEGVQKYLFYISKKAKNADIYSALKKHTDFNDLYWNNVYNLEERDLTEEDVQNIYKRCFSEHRIQAINYLVGRFDYTYFTKINIELLYKVLDEYNENSHEYSKLINQMFRISYNEDRDYYSDAKAKIIPYNELLDMLYDNLKDEISIRFKSFSVLTIYLYDLERSETNALWMEFYLKYPDAFYEIINKYNNNVHPSINRNIKKILKSMMEENDGEFCDLKALYDANVADINVARNNHLQSLLRELLSGIEGDNN